MFLKDEENPKREENPTPKKTIVLPQKLVQDNTDWGEHTTRIKSSQLANSSTKKIVLPLLTKPEAQVSDLGLFSPSTKEDEENNDNRKKRKREKKEKKKKKKQKKEQLKQNSEARCEPKLFFCISLNNHFIFLEELSKRQFHSRRSWLDA